ncbi:hypothetical protein EDB83DRAFT_2415098, partial [Lactarius deliciosus]
SEILKAASEFNVQDTSPDLQHEFCALWNQIVLKAQNDHDQRMASLTLRPIRNVYIALHEGTDSAPTQFSASTRDLGYILFDPTPYPRCDVVSHIHDSAFTALARTVLHDNDAALPAPVVSPDVPSSSDVPAPPHVVENLTDMPVLDDFHPRTAHQTTTENLSIPVTSTDTTTADASGIILPCPTSSTLTSVPHSSTSPPTAVTLQHSADLLVPSGQPNHPSSASHPILDHSDSTECHRLAIVPVTPSASTGPASAPDLGAAAKDNDSSKPSPRKERGVRSDPPSAIRAIHANAMVTLDLPPPSPLSVTDVDPTIAGSSLREPNADRTGDLPLDPLHCPYDIV